MAREADFSEATKKVIAKRAGYRCSFPGCGRTTIGPGKSSGQVEQTGEAAHIFAASSGAKAPRGIGGLSIEDRMKPENGVWMCSKHARLIDQNTGVRYPEPEIQRWKAVHEARVDHEHRGLRVPTGWMSKLELVSSPIFRANTIVEFGKVTLIIGSNATGKTAICDWIAASAGLLDRAYRWMRRRDDREALYFRLHCSNPDPQVLTTQVDNSHIAFKIEGRDALDFSHSLSVIFVANDEKTCKLAQIDDLTAVANACGVPRHRIAQALPYIANLGLPSIFDPGIETIGAQELDEDFSDEDFSDELWRAGLDAPQRLRFRIGGNPEVLPYRNLSSREQSLVKISIAIVLACLSSLHRATLLVFDLGSNFMPESLIESYAALLGEARFGFQSVFVSQREHPEVKWSGWSVARLVGKAPFVTCVQDWW